MTTRIVALDPGGTTGWAYVDIANTGELKFNCGMLQALSHHKELYDLLGTLQTDDFIIISESFEYRNANRPGLVLASVEYIGVTRLFCRERDVPLFFQMAAQGKVRDKTNAFIKPENLKRLGLYHPNMVHAMDAYGHLLWFLINELPKQGRGMVYAELAAELLIKGWKLN